MTTNLPLRVRFSLVAVAAAASATLTGCGGGSSDNAAPPASTALALSGTATDGSANPIASRAVDAKCSTGSGATTTNGSGSFTLSIDGAKLPCVARVTKADGSVLHTVATGSGTSVIANITPATQLIVANLAGTDPATYYDTGFVATPPTAAAVTASQGAVVATLKSGGIDFTPAGDLIGAAPTPAYTTALASLSSTLAAVGTTLPVLTATIAATSITTATGSATTSGVASLPADLLLKPAASNCPALRSGSYRVVAPFEGPALADKYGKLVINAATLAVVFTDGSTGTWVANGPCRYSDDGGRTDIVVSQAGVLSARYTNDAGATYRPAIAFPEQGHTLAEVAGTWNAIGLNRNDANTAYTGVAFTATFDGAGAISAVTFCQDDAAWSLTGAACSSPVPSVSLRANADGGFDTVDKATGALNGRNFAYRAGGGELTLIRVNGDGSFHLLTRQRTNALPAVGAMQTFWSLTVNNQLSAAGPLNVSSNTIVSVDSAAASWLRSQKTVGGANDSPHPETLFANQPRNGYTLRAAGMATAADGSTATFGEFTVLGLRGMGLNPLILPASKTFVLSVAQP